MIFNLYKEHTIVCDIGVRLAKWTNDYSNVVNWWKLADALTKFFAAFSTSLLFAHPIAHSLPLDPSPGSTLSVRLCLPLESVTSKPLRNPSMVTSTNFFASNDYYKRPIGRWPAVLFLWPSCWRCTSGENELVLKSLVTRQLVTKLRLVTKIYPVNSGEYKLTNLHGSIEFAAAYQATANKQTVSTPPVLLFVRL